MHKYKDKQKKYIQKLYHDYVLNLKINFIYHSIMDSIKQQKKYKEQKVLEKKKAKDIIKKQKTRIASWVILVNNTKMVSQGKIIRKRKNTGEKELFKKVRDSRPHYCIICKKHIIEAQARCFAHLLAKGMYQKYRLYEANIALVCSIECHKCIDSIVVWYSKNIVQYLLDQWSDIYYIIKMIWK